MTLDQYIAELTKLRQAHGPDLQVIRVSSSGYVTKASLPGVTWLRKDKVKTLFKVGLDLDQIKGDKVVRV